MPNLSVKERLPSTINDEKLARMLQTEWGDELKEQSWA
jgi:hypothetical protein